MCVLLYLFPHFINEYLAFSRNDANFMAGQASPSPDYFSLSTICNITSLAGDPISMERSPNAIMLTFFLSGE